MFADTCFRANAWFACQLIVFISPKATLKCLDKLSRQLLLCTSKLAAHHYISLVVYESWHIHCSMCSWGTGFDYYIVKAVWYYKYSWMAGNESTRSFHRYSSVWKSHSFIAYKKVCLFRNLNAKIDAFPFQKKKVHILEQRTLVACFERIGLQVWLLINYVIIWQIDFGIDFVFLAGVCCFNLCF